MKARDKIPATPMSFVVSEVMTPQPVPAVLAWLDKQVAKALHLSIVTAAELLFAIGVLPSGRRR